MCGGSCGSGWGWEDRRYSRSPSVDWAVSAPGAARRSWTSKMADMPPRDSVLKKRSPKKTESHGGQESSRLVGDCVLYCFVVNGSIPLKPHFEVFIRSQPGHCARHSRDVLVNNPEFIASQLVGRTTCFVRSSLGERRSGDEDLQRER